MVEGHRARSTSGRKGPEDRYVTELLGERYERLDYPRTVGGGIHSLDLAATAVEVTDDVTHVVLRSHDLEGHDRFEKYWLCLRAGMAESHARCHLEGKLIRIDRMVGTVDDGNLHRLDLVTCKDTVGHCRLEALFDARDEFLRDISSLDLVVELKTGNAFIGRTDLNDDVSELASAAGLLLEDLAQLDAAGDGLLVVDLRSTLVDLDAEFTAETVHDDVQVKFAHTTDDGLAGLVVGPYGERRVFLSEFAESDAEFVQI